MKALLLLVYVLSFNTPVPAQKHGVDTLAGYILKTNDTIAGHVILPYRMVKVKKEFNKQYENEEWYQQVRFVDGSGVEKLFLPSDISAYGWNWNDTLKATFRSFKVEVPHKGAFQFKGQAKPFLKLEIEGPVSLYLYYHREAGPGSTTYFSDRYLMNEQGEMQPLKIKMMLGIAYNLTDLESWFEGYPDLSKFNMKDMIALEVWYLVTGYNKWKKTASQ